jgi:DnaJ-class molecular chaperone
LLHFRVLFEKKKAGRKLKLKLPLLDGTFLTFETRGRISHGAAQEFPGRGMPLTGSQGHGKLFVQFQFTDILESEPAEAR